MDEKELLFVIEYLQKDLKEIKKRFKNKSYHNDFDYLTRFKIAYNIVVCYLAIEELLG